MQMGMLEYSITKVISSFKYRFKMMKTLFFFPSGIAIDSDNNVYVTNLGGEELLRVFDNQGSFQFSFSYPDFGSSGFLSTGGITTDRSNNFYLTDYYQGDVKVFRHQP